MNNDNIREPDESYKDILLNDNSNYNSDNEIEDEIKLAIELSNVDYFQKFEDLFIQESMDTYNEELRQINKNKRINSLTNFTNRIKALQFTEKDKCLKIYIETALNKYFELEIDFIEITDIDLYNELYKLIDSYYIEPLKKNYKKFAITEEEDRILRNFFIKKYKI